MVIYVPDRGDLVWLQFDPQTGHEEEGRRSGLTLLPEAYNEKACIVIFCPVASNEKDYPFEVKMEE